MTVLLDRPAVRNAVDRATAEALAEAFRAFEADETLRVAVLAGAGEHFCAGADLKAFAAGQPNRLEPDGDGPMGPTRMLLGKPVIAAINGYAVAGGLELALWCDLRIMEEDAVVGVFCRRWGVPLIDGGTVRLPRLIGLSRALDLILMGRPVDARRRRWRWAWRIGRAHRHSAPGGGALAPELAGLPQVCLRSDRLSAYEADSLPFEQAMANEFQRGLSVVRAGAAEGARRFTAGAGRHGSPDADSPLM